MKWYGRGMKPLVFVFRLHEIPFVASALASLTITLPEGAQNALHYAYDAADEACAAELDAVEEPEEDAAMSKDVLAFDHAVADTLEARWPRADDRTLRFGYNAGLSFEDAAAKLKSGGFEVQPFDGVVTDELAKPWGAVAELAALLGGNKAIDAIRLEALMVLVPTPLFETRAMKELVAKVLGKSPPLRLTAPTLTRLLAIGAAPAEELARAADASAKDIAPVAATAKDIAGDLAPMLNALKNVLGTVVNVVAATTFMLVAPERINWPVAGLIAAGALIGGYVGARVGRRLSPRVLRGLIVVIGVLAIAKIVVS